MRKGCVAVSTEAPTNWFRMGSQCSCDRCATPQQVGEPAEAKDEKMDRFRKVMRRSFKGPIDAFQCLDRDGDASLTKDEFKEALQESAVKHGWDAETKTFMQESAGVIFDEMDASGDGTLTLQEFKDRLMKSNSMDAGAFGSPQAVKDKATKADKEKPKKRLSRKESADQAFEAKDADEEEVASPKEKSAKNPKRLSRKGSVDTENQSVDANAEEVASPKEKSAKNPKRLSRKGSVDTENQSADANAEEAQSPNERPRKLSKGFEADQEDSVKPRRKSVKSTKSLDDQENQPPDALQTLKGLLRKSFKDPLEAFKILDKDGDLALEESEFKEMLSKVGDENGWKAEDKRAMEQMACQIFKQMDANQDGSVTRKEFKRALTKSLS